MGPVQPLLVRKRAVEPCGLYRTLWRVRGRPALLRRLYAMAERARRWLGRVGGGAQGAGFSEALSGWLWSDECSVQQPAGVPLRGLTPRLLIS